MNFVISSKQLLHHLLIVGNSLKTNTALPILENVLFEINGEEIKITASDLSTTICSQLKVSTREQKKLTTALPARFLIDTLKTFADVPLTFSIDEKTHAVTISSDYGKYEMQGEEGSHFPKAQEIETPYTIHLETSHFINSINCSLTAVSNDEMRQIMTGVLFDFDSDTVHFVSSDGSKLVKYNISCKGQRNNISQLIVPSRSLSIVKNVIGFHDNEKIEIKYSDSSIIFLLNTTSITCKLIEGKYPNYNAVIPKNNTNQLIINKETLLSSLKRVSMFASKATFLVKLQLKGNSLKMIAKDPDFMNSAEETLAAEYKGEDLEIGFNSKFLYDLVNNINSEEVCFKFATPTTGALILSASEEKETSPSVVMLLMPLGN